MGAGPQLLFSIGNYVFLRIFNWLFPWIRIRTRLPLLYGPIGGCYCTLLYSILFYIYFNKVWLTQGFSKSQPRFINAHMFVFWNHCNNPFILELCISACGSYLITCHWKLLAAVMGTGSCSSLCSAMLIFSMLWEDYGVQIQLYAYSTKASQMVYIEILFQDKTSGAINWLEFFMLTSGFFFHALFDHLVQVYKSSIWYQMHITSSGIAIFRYLSRICEHYLFSNSHIQVVLKHLMIKPQSEDDFYYSIQVSYALSFPLKLMPQSPFSHYAMLCSFYIFINYVQAQILRSFTNLPALHTPLSFFTMLCTPKPPLYWTVQAMHRVLHQFFSSINVLQSTVCYIFITFFWVVLWLSSMLMLNLM